MLPFDSVFNWMYVGSTPKSLKVFTTSMQKGHVVLPKITTLIITTIRSPIYNLQYVWGRKAEH